MGKTYPRVTELLKREFEEKGVSKYSFCKQTGINPTSVERYLCGISEPNQSSLERLAGYFGVGVAWLRGERGGSYEEECYFHEQVNSMFKRYQQNYETFSCEGKGGFSILKQTVISAFLKMPPMERKALIDVLESRLNDPVAPEINQLSEGV